MSSQKGGGGSICVNVIFATVTGIYLWLVDEDTRCFYLNSDNEMIDVAHLWRVCLIVVFISHTVGIMLGAFMLLGLSSIYMILSLSSGLLGLAGIIMMHVVRFRESG